MNVGHVGFLTLFNAVYRQRLRDPFTMYKVMRRDLPVRPHFRMRPVRLRLGADCEAGASRLPAARDPRDLSLTLISRGKKIAFVRDPLTWIRACFKYRFVRLYPDD